MSTIAFIDVNFEKEIIVGGRVDMMQVPLSEFLPLMKKSSCEKIEEQTIFSENGPILDQTFEVEQMRKKTFLMIFCLGKDWASLQPLLASAYIEGHAPFMNGTCMHTLPRGSNNCVCRL